MGPDGKTYRQIFKSVLWDDHKFLEKQDDQEKRKVEENEEKYQNKIKFKK